MYLSYDIFLHKIIHFKRFTLNMYAIGKFLYTCIIHVRYALETDLQTYTFTYNFLRNIPILVMHAYCFHHVCVFAN